MPKTKRKPPKRTRRVSAPFDARLEVRMYSTEKAKLDREAADRGMSASDLVRFQLGDLIAAAPPTPQEAAAPMVSLVDALAEGFDLRPGKAMLCIRLGKVMVGGEPWPHEQIPEDLLPQVTLAGDPLVR